MKIVYYKSLICPRCIPTNRLIARLKREYPEIQVEEVEVLAHLSRALEDGVHTLPTLAVGRARFTYAPQWEALLAVIDAESANPSPGSQHDPTMGVEGRTAGA
ncbi:MAG: hypothetical protein ACM3JD_07280 [Rudaea sp.]